MSNNKSVKKITTRLFFLNPFTLYLFIHCYERQAQVDTTVIFNTIFLNVTQNSLQPDKCRCTNVHGYVVVKVGVIKR